MEGLGNHASVQDGGGHQGAVQGGNGGDAVEAAGDFRPVVGGVGHDETARFQRQFEFHPPVETERPAVGLQALLFELVHSELAEDGIDGFREGFFPA